MGLEKENVKSGDIIDTKVLRKLYEFVTPYKQQFYILVALTLLLAVLAPTRPLLIQKAIDDYVTLGDAAGLMRMTYLLIGYTCIGAIWSYLPLWLDRSGYNPGYTGQTIQAFIENALKIL